MMPPAVWELWILCFWWSVWTLADKYLITFHPIPELTGLAMCAIVWVMYQCRGQNVLSTITQTGDV